MERRKYKDIFLNEEDTMHVSKNFLKTFPVVEGMWSLKMATIFGCHLINPPPLPSISIRTMHIYDREESRGPFQYIPLRNKF